MSAPYAANPRMSRGRLYPESASPTRTVVSFLLLRRPVVPAAAMEAITAIAATTISASPTRILLLDTLTLLDVAI